MITITKQDNGVLFTFENSDKYLYGNGTIEVPFNTLSIIADESDMITLKKAASNDVFLSARFDTDLGYRSKDDAIDDLKDLLFAETGGGSESGITSGEVQTMIDESISGKADTAVVNQAIIEATQAILSVSGDVQTKVATSDFNVYSAATDARIAEDEEVTAAALNDLDEKIGDPYQKISGLTIETDEEEDFPFIRIEKEFEDGNSNYTYINDAALESRFENNTEGSNYSSYIGQGSIGNSAVDYPDENVASERNLEVTTDGFRQTTFENYEESGYTRYSSENEFNYSNGLTLSQQWYDERSDTTTNSNIDIINNSEGETYIGLTDTNERTVSIAPNMLSWDDGRDSGGIEWNNIASLTDVDAAVSGKADTSAVTAAIDAAISGKADTSAVTAISDSLSGYVQTSAVTTSVTSGSTDSEIPTAKAVYDAIPTGGGATYSAGTNISIDTGNTINCTLPITAGTYGALSIGTSSAKATRSFAGGEGCGVNINCSNGFSFGLSNTVSATAGTAFGFKTNASVYGSFVCGKWNDMANAGTGDVFGSSGNTVFAVGNGWKQNDWTSGNATKHNALDIRQNGDIYFPDTDNTTYANFYQKPMVRLQDMYGALGGLKFVSLSQAEYDLLVQGGTVQSDTLYIITNIVS